MTGIRSAPSTPRIFDIAGPLPRGTTVLEASAGTGKTWAIAALVARYVAEGVPLERLLVVTFGRAATEELRERVRERLTRTERVLRAALDRGAGDEQALDDLALDDLNLDDLNLDDLDRIVIGSPAEPNWAEQLRERHRRIRDALGAFDDATINTIHQFCQSVLRSLGVAGDTDPGTTLIEDLSDLVHEVADDLYLARYRHAPATPFPHRVARRIASAVTEDSAARIGPPGAHPDSADGERVAYAEAVRAELDVRKRRLGLLSYDDLLRDLANALESPDAPARERMRARWSVVLVDEFQDTDPVQWQVFERAFHGHATLVLIGDPKQAIYNFRGGDINTYLRARGLADQQQTLATNRRTDAPLVAALSAGLEGLALGDPAVVVHRVDASQAASRLANLPVPHPWRLRVATGAQLGVDPDRLPRVGETRPAIARDCATDIAAVLASGATFAGRAVHPGDIAVLSATGKQLRMVRDALLSLGIPAVLAGDESVFAAPAARWWLMLLEAMEQPNRSRRVRTAALTPFIGQGILELDAGGESLTDAIATTVRRWAELFALRGIPAVAAAAQAAGLHERLLAEPGGERSVTDVQHLAELLHEAALRERLGLNALTTWLREQLSDDAARPSAQRSRRLESDAAAVQLATIHASKGLQFPIVYAPFLADRFDPTTGSVERDGSRSTFLRYHDERGQRVIDVRDEPDVDVLAQARVEDDGESLRLLYVALTRAQSQLVTWWAPSTNAASAPLHRALLGRSPGGIGTPEATVRVPSKRVVVDRLDAWRLAGGPQPEWMDATAVALPTPAETPGPPLAIRSFAREVDLQWRRTSYSALTKGAEGAGHPGAPAFEPEHLGTDDEVPGTQVVPPAGLGDGGDAPDVPSPMAELPVGATFGSLVHAVLEEADPQAPDLHAELTRHITEQLLTWPVSLSPSVLATALEAVCHSPLGPLAPGQTLATIGRANRLCEMDFELPLAGGDQGPTGSQPRLADLAPLLREHLPAGDPLLDYAAALEDPELGGQLLRGYLTGSVDVVLRVDARYLVVDYKTNWLGPPDIALTAANYRPEALVAAMQHSSYPLQALLYAVVLHRFLRWRLPGYDPAQHFGGVLYLYVRGMCGPQTPLVDGQPAGVFSWQPPVALVESLSALLDGHPREPRAIGGTP